MSVVFLSGSVCTATEKKAKINFAFFACRVDMRKVTAYNAVKRKIIFAIKKIKFRNELQNSLAHSHDFRVV